MEDFDYCCVSKCSAHHSALFWLSGYASLTDPIVGDTIHAHGSISKEDDLR